MRFAAFYLYEFVLLKSKVKMKWNYTETLVNQNHRQFNCRSSADAVVRLWMIFMGHETILSSILGNLHSKRMRDRLRPHFIQINKSMGRLESIRSGSSLVNWRRKIWLMNYSVQCLSASQCNDWTLWWNWKEMRLLDAHVQCASASVGVNRSLQRISHKIYIFSLFSS